jgi:hypothetical protein
MSRHPEKGKSPYVRYGKRPHVYSATYQQWRAAVRAGRKPEAETLAATHEREFGYRRPRGLDRVAAMFD